MSVPVHHDRASPTRRFVAGGINLLVIGLSVITAEACAAALGASAKQADTVRLFTLGLVTLYWVACVLKRRSLGGAFCLIEARSVGFKPMTLRASLLRTFPVYAAAIVAYAPSGVTPPAILEIRPVFLLMLALVLAADGVVLAVSGRTMLDRALRIDVWRLNLPGHLRPRLFGQRVV